MVALQKDYSTGQEQKSRPASNVPDLAVFDYYDLLQEEFEPLRWIIPDYLPEGATLLFSRPKVGKSMTSLALALRVARRVSGGIDGETLYLNLDDTNRRRIQSRTRSLLQGNELEKGRIWGATESRGLDDGLIQQLDSWMYYHPDTRLVVIDVYARVKPRKQDDDVYKSDYGALTKLQEFAVKHHIAIIIVHHTRKAKDNGDWIDSVNGSTGLTGAVDTLWMIERTPKSNDLTLRVKGRDTMGELEVRFSLDDIDAPWKLAGEDEQESEENTTTEKILAILRETNANMKPAEITAMTGLRHGTVLKELRRMHSKNLVIQETYGSYRMATLTNLNTCHSVAILPQTQAVPSVEAPELPKNGDDDKNAPIAILVLNEPSNAATEPETQEWQQNGDDDKNAPIAILPDVQGYLDILGEPWCMIDNYRNWLQIYSSKGSPSFVVDIGGKSFERKGTELIKIIRWLLDGKGKQLGDDGFAGQQYAGRLLKTMGEP